MHPRDDDRPDVKLPGAMAARWRFLLLLFFLAAGSIAAGTLGLVLPPTAAALLFLALLIPPLLRPSWALLLPALSLLLFFHGNHRVAALLSDVHPQGHICRSDGRRLTVEGVVAERPGRSDGGGRLLLEVTAAGADGAMDRASGRLLVRGGEGGFALATGDLVRVTGRIRIPRPLGLPGEFDYGRHLALQGIGATMFLPRSDAAVLVAPAAAHPQRRWIDAVAAAGGRAIDSAVDGTAAEVLKALLTGERGGVPRELEEIYARAGVSHLLSISGFHVGVLALVVTQLLFLLARRSERFLLYCNVRRLLPLLTLPVIVFYLLLSGGAIATVRSVIMAAICALILLAEREIDPLHSLFLAALVILTAAPEAVYDISFQLSFMALWGIMLTAPLVQGPVASIPSAPLRWTVALSVASTAATLATLAPVAWHFNRGSLTGIIANLAAIPLVGYGGVAVGFAGLLLSAPIPSLGALLLQGAALLVRLANDIIGMMAAIPPLHWAADGHDVLWTVAGLLVLSLAEGLRRRLALLSALLAGWGVTALLAVPQLEGKLWVHFLSVGQGDAALIRTPTGETMLVDGGGYPGERGDRFGRRTLVPALERLGVRRIDRLVLSHAHPDHMGGLPAVVERFPVEEFWAPAGDVGSAELQSLQRLVVERGGRVRGVTGGSPATALGGCTVQFLAPLPDGSEDGNEGSLVLRVGWQGWHVLLTGDIGADTESRLLAAGVPLRAQLLKVPHHGSRYSSTTPFLAAVAPHEAVISVGRGNIYGLPAPESVERLRRQGARVHRTDQGGTVTAVCDQDTMRVFEYNEQTAMGSHFH